MSKCEKDSTNVQLKGKTFKFKTMEKRKLNIKQPEENDKNQSVNNEIQNRKIIEKSTTLKVCTLKNAKR